YALHDVHYSLRNPDLGRSPAPLLEPALYTRHGMVSFPVSGPGGSDLDLEGRFGDLARLARNPRCPSLHRASPLVAFFDCDVVDDQWYRVLCADFCDRSVAPPRPGDVGRVSGCALDRPPVCVTEFSGRRKLDPLQRITTAQLFHHSVCRRTSFDSHRPHAEPGDLQSVQLSWKIAESADGPLHPFHLVLLVRAVYLGARHHGVCYRFAAEHEPHVRGGGEPLVGRVPAFRHGHDACGTGLVDRFTFHDPPRPSGTTDGAIHGRVGQGVGREVGPERP